LSHSNPYKWVLQTPASHTSSSTSTTSSSLQTWDGIIHVAKTNALICQECQVLVPMSVLARHLDLSHRAVPARRRREIKAGFCDLPVIRTWREVQPRPDHSLPMSYLKDPVLGFPCPYCTTFKTTSRDCLRHHRLASHPEHRGDPDSASPTCSLQSWTNRRAYALRIIPTRLRSETIESWVETQPGHSPRQYLAG
jgi:hypothetical protein